MFSYLTVYWAAMAFFCIIIKMYKSYEVGTLPCFVALSSITAFFAGLFGVRFYVQTLIFLIAFFACMTISIIASKKHSLGKDEFPHKYIIITKTNKNEYGKAYRNGKIFSYCNRTNKKISEGTVKKVYKEPSGNSIDIVF